MSEIPEKEIGGFLELERLAGREWKEDLFDVNYGRNALRLLIRERKIRHIYLPDYNCDSVLNACRQENTEISLYPIDRDFLPVFERELAEGEYFYVIDYWGLLTEETMAGLMKRFGNLIFDFTHSFFKAAPQGADTIYSCRKFFGVPDGAYICPAEPIRMELPYETVLDKLIPFVGRMEKGANAVYAEYRKTEEAIDSCGIRRMSLFSHNLLRAIPYDEIRRRRNENFRLCQTAFAGINQIHPRAYEGPFVYPLLVDGGDVLRRRLAEKRIYVPCLWSNVLETSPENSFAYHCAANLVPLPVDQRYGAEEMRHVIKTVEDLLGGDLKEK